MGVGRPVALRRPRRRAGQDPRPPRRAGRNPHRARRIGRRRAGRGDRPRGHARRQAARRLHHRHRRPGRAPRPAGRPAAGLPGAGRGGGDRGIAPDTERQTRHRGPAGARIHRRPVSGAGHAHRGDLGRHLRPGARARARRRGRLLLRPGRGFAVGHAGDRRDQLRSRRAPRRANAVRSAHNRRAGGARQRERGAPDRRGAARAAGGGAVVVRSVAAVVHRSAARPVTGVQHGRGTAPRRTPGRRCAGCRVRRRGGAAREFADGVRRHRGHTAPGGAAARSGRRHMADHRRHRLVTGPAGRRHPRRGPAHLRPGDRNPLASMPFPPRRRGTRAGGRGAPHRGRRVVADSAGAGPGARLCQPVGRGYAGLGAAAGALRRLHALAARPVR